ncbi:hypothetical protein CHLRE_08g365027v5 [Chlamydomonas reinhardtii]|uniref:Protein kinase domain-containing protein n=1 Tax=Chlamydomonas reinhardtii TaxID=3055 RepID=A0A2K3DGU1_CHLRE|nr:uncharacterized protein CHLRE_08g365027v5 [Chlamydomonas reinhardtii]PNW79748.1 hypothetical protein CHLRE_08g365027v5 [Chlamydomonas reinhardtii]
MQVSVEVGQNNKQLQWPRGVHAGVQSLGQRMLATRPEQRPTAAQVAAEVAVLLQQVPQYA